MKKCLALCLALMFLMFTGARGDGVIAANPLRGGATEITQIIAKMPLEEKVAQMFLTRYPASDEVETISGYQPGGYILFANDFKDRDAWQVREMISGLQRGAKLGMLIGIDEEGGTVTRVSRYPALRSEKFRSPKALYDEGGIARTVEDAQEKSAFLKALGINFNLAPVADVSVSEKDFIYDRTLGQDAPTTAAYVSSIVGAMNQAGMASALKHFPGYGNNLDTHFGIATDLRDYQEFVRNDFLPFEAGIAAGAACVLVSHNIVTAMDDALPASLSPEAHRVLREELGFKGVIMTDDLYMDAIKQYTDDSSAAVLAVEAGNDLLCCTDFVTQYSAVLDAVKRGRITEERIDQSVTRLLNWKRAFGII